MSARPLPRSRLDNLIPPLVDGHALVALVPATGDLKWATAAAWDVARAAAGLLLLYLAAGALARLSAVPDGLIVLSPDGFEPESSIGQGISAALERGIPLVGVVRERWTPEPEVPAATPRMARPAPPARADGRSVSRRTRPAVVAATLIGGAAVGWVLFATGGESFRAS